MFPRTFVKSLNSTLALAGVAGALLATALISPVAADEAGNASGIRTATEQYQGVAAAEDAGYALLKDTAGIACIDDPTGAMGIHYANGDLVAGGVIDALKPQVLVYEPGEGDARRLADVGDERVRVGDGRGVTAGEEGSARCLPLRRRARQCPSERGLGDTGDRNPEVERRLNRPAAGALLLGLVHDDVHKRLPGGRVDLAQHPQAVPH